MGDDFMKKIRLSCLFIIILTLGLLILPTNTIAASTKVYNMNNFSVYKGRSKTDIVRNFQVQHQVIIQVHFLKLKVQKSQHIKKQL